MLVKKEFTIFLFLLLLLNISSALSCSSNNINTTINSGDNLPSPTMTCTNNNNYNVTLFKSGNFFSTNPSTITIPNQSSSTIIINYDTQVEGNYQGFLYSSDGTTININLNIKSIAYDIIVFPTSKIVNIQQGQTKNINVQVIVPSNYPDSITIQSITTNPEIETLHFSDLDLGLINPGQTLNIPIIIDAVGVQTGTYNTQVSILATGDSGQINLPSVNMQVIVSLGVSPTTNDTFTTKPSCSLSANEFNMNNTYKLTCTNVIDNLEIKPYYNEYLEGTKAEYLSGTYNYYFKAKKMGSSTFIAIFEYKGSPLFEAFQKDFKVTPSGNSPVGGVYITLKFFQKGELRTINNLKPESTVIVAVDNFTSNAIENFKVYVSGVITNTTLDIEPNKIYYVRVTASGYNDLVIENLSSQTTNISVTISPDLSEYKVGDSINITSDVNGTILVDNSIVSNQYTFNHAGEFLLSVQKEGYNDFFKNLTVKSSVLYTSNIPYEDWYVNKKIILKLTENVSWFIEFEEYKDEAYLTATNLTNGYGDTIELKPEKEGNYRVKSSGSNMVVQKFMEKTWSWYNPLSWSWIAWVISAVIILFIGWFFLRDDDDGVIGGE